MERNQKKHRKHEEDTPARKKEHGSSQKEDDASLQKKKKRKLIEEPVEEISTPIAGSSAKNRSQKHAEGTPLRREKLTKEHKSSQEEEDAPTQKKKKKKLIKEPIEESSTPIEESSAQRNGKRERLRKEKSSELIAVNKEKENKKKKKSSELIAVNKEKESKKKKKRKKILKVDLDSSLSGKRRRLEEDPQADVSVREHHRAMSLDVLFVLLVPSKDLGKVIGQHGSRIQALREKTGAQIKIGDAIMNLEERIIWISSKEDSLESQSAAERALLHVATLLVEPENEGQEIAKIRLLIAGSQAGSVVGKAGVAINELQKNTGAIVQVLTKDKFPLLAFASETDRLVQLEGEVSQVLKALELIAVKLRKSPRYSKSVKGHKGLMLKKGGAFEASVQIRIPNDLRGNVIGKGGANISQITQQCGAVSIQVDKSKDDAQDTTIHLKGTLSQVTMAQALLQVFLASKQRTE